MSPFLCVLVHYCAITKWLPYLHQHLGIQESVPWVYQPTRHLRHHYRIPQNAQWQNFKGQLPTLHRKISSFCTWRISARHAKWICARSFSFADSFPICTILYFQLWNSLASEIFRLPHQFCYGRVQLYVVHLICERSYSRTQIMSFSLTVLSRSSKTDRVKCKILQIEYRGSSMHLQSCHHIFPGNTCRYYHCSVSPVILQVLNFFLLALQDKISVFDTYLVLLKKKKNNVTANYNT